MIGEYADINVNLRHWVPRVLAFLRESRERVVYYDIGANDGALSIPYLGDIDTLLAFEPGPAGDRFLDRAPEDSRERVKLYRIALGGRRECADLAVYSDDTFSSLYERPERDLDQYHLQRSGTVRVPVWPLDDFIVREGLPAPDFVKIDIEGAELFALQGMRATLSGTGAAILIEYSCINTQNAGYDRREILELLHEYGYAPKGLFRAEKLHLHEGADLDPCGIWNLLCLPPGFPADR